MLADMISDDFDFGGHQTLISIGVVRGPAKMFTGEQRSQLGYEVGPEGDLWLSYTSGSSGLFS